MAEDNVSELVRKGDVPRILREASLDGNALHLSETDIECIRQKDDVVRINIDVHCPEDGLRVIAFVRANNVNYGWQEPPHLMIPP